MARVIRNKTTGEMKVIEDNELDSYMGKQTGAFAGTDQTLNPVVLKYIQSAMTKPGSTTAGRLLTQATSLKDLLGSDETAEMKNKKMSKKDGQRVLEVLENNYFFGQRGPLAYADKGVEGRVKGMAEDIQSKISADYNPELLSYLQLLESSRPMFAKAAGDVGNMSQSEQQVAIKSIPTGKNSFTEAKMFFNNMRKRMGIEERDFDAELATAGVTQTTKGDGTAIPLSIKGMRKSVKPAITEELTETSQPTETKQSGSWLKNLIPSMSDLIAGVTSKNPAMAGIVGAGYQGLDDLIFALTAPDADPNTPGKQVTQEHAKRIEEMGSFGSNFARYGASAGRSAALNKLLAPIANAPFRGLINKGATQPINSRKLTQAVTSRAGEVVGGKSAAKSIMPTIKKKMTAADLDKLLSSWGARTWSSSSGDPKATAIAQVLKPTYGVGRRMLAEANPRSSLARTGTEQIINLLNTLKRLRSMAGTAAVGAGVGGGTAIAMNKLLQKE